MISNGKINTPRREPETGDIGSGRKSGDMQLSPLPVKTHERPDYLEEVQCGQYPQAPFRISNGKVNQTRRDHELDDNGKARKPGDMHHGRNLKALGSGRSLGVGELKLGRQWGAAEVAFGVPAIVNDSAAFWALKAHGVGSCLSIDGHVLWRGLPPTFREC